MKRTKNKPPRVLLLVGCIILCLLAGIIGGLFTTTGPGSWYTGIAKPAFNPPNWVFGPVWTTLYIMMGVSLYLAIRSGAKRMAYWVFGAQLALNTLWSIAFFGLQSPALALTVIALLWMSILWNIIEFWRTSNAAGYLLIPYLLWVSFASALNLAIFLLN